MKRKQKIELLKQIEGGFLTLDGLRKLANRAGVVLYFEDRAGLQYRLPGSKTVMSPKDMDEHIKNLKTVLFLPENFRERFNGTEY